MRSITSLLLVAVAGLAACSSNSGSASSSRMSTTGSQTISAPQSGQVDRAATIAKAIRANPDNAEQILSQNGMTEEQYEALMYEIASDPAMSAEYNAKVGP